VQLHDKPRKQQMYIGNLLSGDSLVGCDEVDGLQDKQSSEWIVKFEIKMEQVSPQPPRNFGLYGLIVILFSTNVTLNINLGSNFWGINTTHRTFYSTKNYAHTPTISVPFSQDIDSVSYEEQLVDCVHKSKRCLSKVLHETHKILLRD
jgi:hypothetical protein